MNELEQDFNSGKFRQILGVRFFVGSVHETIERIRRGGLLVIPAAPGLKDIHVRPTYREALLGSDLAITDSAFMVLLWNMIQKDSIPRVSGLKYIKELLQVDEVREPGQTFWVMASKRSAETNLAYLRSRGIEVRPEEVYIAPLYKDEIRDEALVAKLRARKYKHVIVTIGGGTQEQLGLYLKRNLDYLPGIHCVGAAIAFLSGDQVYIPGKADALGLGWFVRCLSKPGLYIPRYWSARKLAWLMIRYRQHLPPMEQLIPAAPLEKKAVGQT